MHSSPLVRGAATFPHPSTAPIAGVDHPIDLSVERMRCSHYVLVESVMCKRSRKLTVEQVLEVRLSYMVGEREWAKLAKKFGLSPEAIKNAAIGLTYKDLPMPPKRMK